MLARMTPEEFSERWAHYLLEPWGDEWEMTGAIAAAVHNAITRYMAAKRGKPLTDKELLKPDEFVPKPPWMLKKRKRRLTTRESEKLLTGS